MNAARPVLWRQERFSVSEVVELLDNIREYKEFHCGLPPVRARGGEVYLYNNAQHPGEEYM